MVIVTFEFFTQAFFQNLHKLQAKKTCNFEMPCYPMGIISYIPRVLCLLLLSRLASFSLSNSKFLLWNYYQVNLIALLNKYIEMPFKEPWGFSNTSCTENYAEEEF